MRQKGLNTAILAMTSDSLGEAASHFADLNCHVACHIAGKPMLIPPHAPASPQPQVTPKPASRIRGLPPPGTRDGFGVP